MFFAHTSHYSVTVLQASAALLLCWIPWAAYRNWLRGDRKKIPLFALVSAMFWLSYGLPLFWGEHEITGVFGRRTLTEEAITDSLFLAIAGVMCLWLGMRAAGRFRWMPKRGADISESPSRWNYLRMVFVIATLVQVLVPITALGPGGRQIVSNFERTVPVIIFAILFRYYLRGRLRQGDKVLILGYFVVALLVGIASGWLGSFVSVGVVCVIVYIYERRRLPVMAALAVLPVVLFFQPAKNIFRERYWREASKDSPAERVGFWVESSWNVWSRALTGQSGGDAVQLADATLSRLSLLQQTASVIELTPDRVPYQHGRLYSYIAVTFVPRFLWPEKPSVNDANQWYQVAYGLSQPKHLSTVSIAIGTVAESYINFGWLGPALIVFPLGVFLGSFERIFLRADSGLLYSSLGAVLIPHLLGIEAQMAQYIAGLVQQIFLVLLVLAPTLETSKQKAAMAAIPYYSRRIEEMRSLSTRISRQ
jgi:hypothetical protein